MNDDILNDMKDDKEASDSPYSSLTGSFDDVELEARDRFYNVGDAAVLIDKIKSALRKSDNGSRLLDLADSKGVTYHLIKSNKLQSATTPDLKLYLSAESGQEEPYVEQILEFGGALREIEQVLMGYTVPPKDMDPLERANKVHTKFLDKIVYMCKIGIDLEIVYGNKVHEAIKAFGFEDIYNAQVKSLSDEQIKNIYLETQPEDKSGTT